MYLPIPFKGTVPPDVLLQFNKYKPFLLSSFVVILKKALNFAISAKLFELKINHYVCLYVHI